MSLRHSLCSKRASPERVTPKILNRHLAGSSIYPAANNGPPWPNEYSALGYRSSNDHGAAGGNAACAIDAARADDGA
jgi:hypothetical protein